MTKARLFIALPVPEGIKQKISDLVAQLQGVRGLPKGIRFIPLENWHFTLTFLGYQPESAIPTIKETIQSMGFVSSYTGFEKLIYGSPGRAPRMLWLTTTKKTSEELGKIKKDLEDELETKGVKWRRELRPYQAHLTLARFEQTPLKSLPKIEKEVDWRYEAREIHLMKSTLKRTGAEYEIIL